MGWILRRSTDRVNPTLAGGVYGVYITAGMGVFWYFDGSRVCFILFVSDGGRYGMNSSGVKVSYKGTDIASGDFKFHPGTYTRQITPYQITSVNHTTNVFTKNAHPFSNGDLVRLHSRGGVLPGNISDDKKYYIVGRTTNDWQVSDTLGGAAIDLADAGSGTLYIWLANAGWDDPAQGLPEFCPQVKTTFSGICYVEGKLPASYTANEEPAWEDFRVEGIGRLLMDYDAGGGELGVTSDAALLENPALCLADVLVTEYAKPLSRIDFPSWMELRESSSVLIWQRTDTTQSGTGWIGKYYNYTGSLPPTVSGATLILTRRDAALDFDFGTAAPAEGVNADFIAVWQSQLKFKYGELYTFKVTRDNGARVYFNGALVYDNWTNTTATDDPFTFTATANQIVTVKVEYFDGGASGKFTLKWQSASLPVEVVPMESAYEPDIQIPRYLIDTAFAKPTEAAEVFERLMERCPGWDWTDKGGKITFLSPDRPIIYEFIFDAEDPDAECTILDKSFEKKIRHRRDRRNFALWSYRNRIYTGFPEGFVEENRPRLRELGNGMPDNDAPEDLMVAYQNHAQRIASAEFKLTTDPPHTLSLASQKPSGIATKNCYARVRNWVKGDRRVEDSVCILTGVNRQGNKLDFTLLPIEYPFYTDEIVEEEKGDEGDGGGIIFDGGGDEKGG
jgi:hypothetical protein